MDNLPLNEGPTWSKPKAIPNRVFKFVEPKYADGFEAGEVRIGTFRGYARMDNARADEGEATVIRDVAYASFEEGDPHLARFRASVSDGGRINISNSALVERLEDTYCFCASLALTAAPAFPHVAFEIVDYPNFIKTLMELNMDRLGPNGEMDRVTYAPRRGAFDDPSLGEADPFVKDTLFEWEQEYRVIFDQHPDAPVAFNSAANDRLARFIRRL